MFDTMLHHARQMTDRTAEAQKLAWSWQVESTKLAMKHLELAHEAQIESVELSMKHGRAAAEAMLHTLETLRVDAESAKA